MTTITAFGSSMFPFVPSGSRLELVSLCDGRSEPRVGDIVAYVGRTGMIAHRVIGIDRSEACARYELRGDAQDFSEMVDRQALAYRVTRVSYAGASYATSGWVGRAFAHLALRHDARVRWLRSLVPAVRRVRQTLS